MIFHVFRDFFAFNFKCFTKTFLNPAADLFEHSPLLFLLLMGKEFIVGEECEIGHNFNEKCRK